MMNYDDKAQVLDRVAWLADIPEERRARWQHEELADLLYILHERLPMTHDEPAGPVGMSYRDTPLDIQELPQIRRPHVKVKKRKKRKATHVTRARYEADRKWEEEMRTMGYDPAAQPNVSGIIKPK